MTPSVWKDVWVQGVAVAGQELLVVVQPVLAEQLILSLCLSLLEVPYFP